MHVSKIDKYLFKNLAYLDICHSKNTTVHTHFLKEGAELILYAIMAEGLIFSFKSNPFLYLLQNDTMPQLYALFVHTPKDHRKRVTKISHINKLPFILTHYYLPENALNLLWIIKLNSPQETDMQFVLIIQL